MDFAIIIIFLFFIVRMGSAAKEYHFSVSKVRINVAVFCSITYAFMVAFQFVSLFLLMKLNGIEDPQEIKSAKIAEIIAFIGGVMMVSIYGKQLKKKMIRANEAAQQGDAAEDASKND